MDLIKAFDRFYYSLVTCELRLLNKKIADENVTFNSLMYLELIYNMEDCTASRIAELLNVSKPGVTQKINEMIKQGLVTRTQDPTDKRRYYLSVNEEAVPKYKIYRRQDAEIIKRICNKYSDEDIAKFCEMLDIVSDINFEEITEE